MYNNKVILVGYSGHGFVVADAAKDNNLNLIGYAEKSVVLNNPFQLNYLGNETDNDFIGWSLDATYLIGVGDNLIREKIFNLIESKDHSVLTLISSSANISATAIIGRGSFVTKNVSINAFANIGKNVILNTACIIEHECVVKDSVHIAPGAVLAGNVIVGERSFIGANSVVKQGVTIGKDVIVGAGTVVLKNIPDGKKVVGNPSRLI